MAYSKEDLQKELLNLGDVNSSKELVKKVEHAIDMICLLVGPKGWQNADPITTVVKLPQPILDIITLLTSLDKDPGYKRQEGIEFFIRRLIMLGLQKIQEDMDEGKYDV